MTTQDVTAIHIPTPRMAMPDYYPNMLERPSVLFGSRHCTAPGCQRTDCETADGVCGRRCAQHPPVFDPAHAVRLAVTSGIGTALGYVRNPDVEVA